MTTQTENIKFRGHVYAVPVATPNEECYMLNSFYLSFLNRNFYPSDGEARLFCKADSRQAAALQLMLSMENPHCNRNCITLCLYREGNSEPLFCDEWPYCSFEENLYNATFFFNQCKTKLSDGRYFLLLAGVKEEDPELRVADCLNGYPVFFMDVLTHGSECTLPPLKEVRGTLKSDDAIGFNLDFAHPFVVPAECTLTCYDAEWNCVASQNRYIAKSRRRQTELSFRLHFSDRWVPGRYYLVFLYNGHAYAMASYEWDGSICRNWSYPDFTTEEDMASQVKFDNSMRRLNEMVGLNELKEQLTSTLYKVRFDIQRKRLGLPTDNDVAHHMIFTGNPGTGKTTVAKLIGELYRSLGLLSVGHVICTERSELVGEYIGQTEELVRTILGRARGNVLFIDEAYTLLGSDEGDRDFGRHVLESLLTTLAQPHDDLIVILAGYEKEMKQLLESNPGLSGRFPNHFHFDDYRADDLMEIGHRWLAKQQYRLTDEAEAAMCRAVGEALDKRDRYFDNARWVKRFLGNGVLPAMAQRVMQPTSVQLSALTDEELRDRLSLITLSDMEQAIVKMGYRPVAPTLTSRRQIGFRA